MLQVEKRYIVDENNQRVAVQIDIQTFERLIQLLEDYYLGKRISENDPEEVLSSEEASVFYQSLTKTD